MTKEEYEADKARRATLAQQQAEVTAGSAPTPTQEENDLAALGLLHPDEKAAASTAEMPSVAAQQAYLALGIDPNLKAGTPLPPAAARQPERATPRTEPPKP